MSLHLRQRADPVSDRGSLLEGKFLTRGLHLICQGLLYLRASAGEELTSLIDKIVIGRFIDPVDTRRAAPLDLILETGAATRLEDRVGAASQ